MSKAEKPVRSLAQFVERTEDILSTWPPRTHDSADPWYRGLRNIGHTLSPTWYRKDVIASGLNEDGLWDEFRRRSLPLLDGQQPKDRWEWSFLMQHYGLPTRLLDWSECSLVSLFFAVSDWKGTGAEPTNHAVVWMLDPSAYNRWATGKNKWPKPTNEVLPYDDARIKNFVAGGKIKLPEYPVAIMPSYNSRRLVAQRGMFTIHGECRDPFEQIYSATPSLTKIVIDQGSIISIRESLRLAGITDVLMFPEMPYLCQDILKAWKLFGKVQVRK